MGNSRKKALQKSDCRGINIEEVSREAVAEVKMLAKGIFAAQHIFEFTRAQGIYKGAGRTKVGNVNQGQGKSLNLILEGVREVLWICEQGENIWNYTL